MLLKIFPFTSPLSAQALLSNHAYLIYLMLQWQLSHLNGHKLDRHKV
jgi:hypothetical protein